VNIISLFENNYTNIFNSRPLNDFIQVRHWFKNTDNFYPNACMQIASLKTGNLYCIALDDDTEVWGRILYKFINLM